MIESGAICYLHIGQSAIFDQMTGFAHDRFRLGLHLFFDLGPFGLSLFAFRSILIPFFLIRFVFQIVSI